MRRRTFTFALLALPCGLSVAHAKAPIHARVRKVLRRIHETSSDHATRIERVSRLFLEKAYHASPLGEGPDGDRDTDPIVDFERFDCVTYVEEVMALAWHADLDAAIERLQDIRYTQGVIAYGARKHITMAQWIPQNAAAGFVTDVTKELDPEHATLAELWLTHAHFRSAKGKVLRLKEDERPLGMHRVPILSANAVSRASQRIPHGTIITTIRASRKHVPYRASHLGLVIARGGKRFVRHAHLNSGRVIEDPIARFLKRAEARASWSVSGFNLLRVAAEPPS